MIGPAPTLADAALLGVTTTVIRTDGEIATGRVRAHPTEPSLYVVGPIGRGIPLVIHPDDLEGLRYE